MITMKTTAQWEKTKSAVFAKAGKHEVIIDEPAGGGGQDLGPNPIELLLSTMSGCFVIVGKMIAKEHKLEVNGIKISMEGDIDPAGYLGKDPKVPVQLQQIRMHLTVDSPAPRDQVEKWVKEVEKRCPVINTVAKGVSVKMDLK